MMKKWKQKELYWLLAFSVCCFGGFYDWTATLIGVAVCVVAALKLRQNKQIKISKEKWIYFLLLQLLGMSLAMITAIDRGINLVGILRFFPVVIWLLLAMQYDKEDRDNALMAVPHIGCLMIAVGLAGYLIPGLRDWLWAADRLGGFFQYSNTCAVYFLLGMLILGDKKTERDKIQWSILFWGILLTGSRTVMLLLLVVLLKELLGKTQDIKMKKIIGANVAAAVVTAFLVVLVSGSYQNLARLATIFTSNSTFYGRLLYWKDAFGLIINHPFGLGWKGYYYIQSAVQTGVYSTIYVHNDLLQAFLDGGWIAGLSFLMFMGAQIKKSPYRFALLILFVHSLVDIDLQYIGIWFVVILMCGFGRENYVLKKDTVKYGRGIFVAVSLMFMYFTIAFGAEFFGDYETAIAWYPGYTQAKEEILARTGNADAVNALADEILEQNQYSSLAYDAKALVSYAKGDIYGFAENKKTVLELEKYDITHYQDYRYLLLQYAEYAAESGDGEIVKFCYECVEEIESLLANVEKNTSALAWKLRDQPTLALE